MQIIDIFHTLQNELLQKAEQLKYDPYLDACSSIVERTFSIFKVNDSVLLVYYIINLTQPVTQDAK